MPEEFNDQAVEDAVDKPLESKKNKKKKKPDKNKGNKKSPLGIVLLAVIIAAVVWVFGFNGMGLRDTYIFPTLRNVPVVKNIIPPAPEEDGEEDEYKDKDRNEVIEDNKKLKAEIEKLEADKEVLQTAINDDKKEITRLKIFETEQAKFKASKKAFDETVANGEIPEYKKYYEEMYPENAEEIYKKIIQNDIKNKEYKNYINTFEGMKKDAAAKILENLTASDMDLVVDILKNLSDNQRSDILSAMDAEKAASCVKRLAP